MNNMLIYLTALQTLFACTHCFAFEGDTLLKGILLVIRKSKMPPL